MNSGLRPALLAYLSEEGGEVLSGRALEVRARAEAWLSYIPHTFPHYTRHTIPHSDEIIVQLSKLLFYEGDPERPVVPLAPIEAYVLVVAAYLHDAGMVASDREKTQLLASDTWKDWTAEGQPGGERWARIEALRHAEEPRDQAIKHFLADLQTRFLIAEFVRRSHSLRAGEVIEEHDLMLGEPSLGDPGLRKVISDVCVAHGLSPYELDDAERYPDRADVWGQLANIRLLAILLRLGDLLDMSTDRACPLLLSAACPLPPDSLAHWTQYQTIRHRLTAPDKIELVSECETQEEHRVLQDWCQWIVDEVGYAGRLLARSHRHSAWSPPLATLEGRAPTIVIRASDTATYIPSRWHFELDPDTVLSRLVNDVYQSPEQFIRELIQNAADATRCHMFADLTDDGIEPPDYPTEVQAAVRERYPVEIRLESRQARSELSGKDENRQILTVVDNGIGMDKFDIETYLLQVGRSFYTTPEFRRRYGFVPASRFGIGFLSVFGASDYVTVETLKESEPIRMTLTGPRNYLLTERGTRTRQGTSVGVELRRPLKAGTLTRLVRQWCRRVEFPILIDDLGSRSEVRSESSGDFEDVRPDVTAADATLAVQSFSIGVPGLEGELYVFVREQGGDASWAHEGWARYEYPKQHPLAAAPMVPPSLICFQGIELQETGWGRGSGSVRVDVRRSMGTDWLQLGRTSVPIDLELRGFPEIERRWEELLEEHLQQSRLASGENGWVYRQRLASDYYHRTSEEFWRNLPKSARVFHGATADLASINELIALPTVTLLSRNRHFYENLPASTELEQEYRAALTEISDGPVMTARDLNRISERLRALLYTDRSPHDARGLGDRFVAVDWSSGGVRDEIESDRHRSMFSIPMSHLDESLIGMEWLKLTDSVYSQILLNSEHEFVQWLHRVTRETGAAITGAVRQLLDMLDGAIRYTTHLDELEAFLRPWDEKTGVEPPPPVLFRNWERRQGLLGLPASEGE